MSNLYFEFIESHIEVAFRDDTNMQIGKYMITQVYPHILVLELNGWSDTQEAWINVECNRTDIKAHYSPLYDFIVQYPEVCERVVKSFAGLEEIYQKWWLQPGGDADSQEGKGSCA